MSRRLRIGGLVLAAVAALVVFAAALLIANLDAIVKTAVETYGPEVTGSRVTLRRVDISPTSGRGSLAGLVVGNPPGFKAASAFELREISVRFDVASVTRDAIVIHEILIDGPEFTLEIGDRGSNIEALSRNAVAFGGGPAAGDDGGRGATEDGVAGPNRPRPHAAPQTPRAAGGPRFVVESLRIRGGTLNLSTMVLEGRTTATRLPDIHLRNIGDGGGAPAGEIVRVVLEAVGRAASEGSLASDPRDAVSATSAPP